MNPKMWNRFTKTNRNLAQRAAMNYCSLLRFCCENHVSLSQTPGLLESINERDWGKVLEIADSLSAQTYSDATSHFVANQFAALVRKYPFLPSELDLSPEASAIEKWRRAEHRCKRINQRFRAFNKRSPNEFLLDRMRSFIRYAIGEQPNISNIFSNAAFGPGASVGVSGNATNLARKLLAPNPSVTPKAFDYAAAAIMTDPRTFELYARRAGQRLFSWDPSLVKNYMANRCCVVKYNKITFVPKTARVHRPIAVEPLLNGYLQSGVDAQLKLHLKRIGIDLSDQSRNRMFAKFGSEDDSKESGFVTIDLSSASDSLAYEVVRYLLPPAWFEFLNELRSPFGKLNDELVEYEKFCSMGNGFCFPLETLIFTAACVAADAGKPRIDFTVYGDDIIVRKGSSEGVISLLNYLGFSVNEEKTFTKGPFRESCGADWFGGEDVRPFTLKFRLDSVTSILKFLNRCQKSPRTAAFFLGLDLDFFKIPGEFRFVRPCKGNDDAALTVPVEQFMSSPFAKWNSALQCWSWRELAFSAVDDKAVWKLGERRFNCALVYAALLGVDSGKPFTLRRSSRTKIRRESYSALCQYERGAPAWDAI